MKKYQAVCQPDVGPEDAEAGRTWEVQHTQNWQDGAYLPPVAQGCTQDYAIRIADCLNACEGVTAAWLNVNKLIEDHTTLKVRYNNLRCDGLGHLRDVLGTLNTRGQLNRGGYAYDTETGAAYRRASDWLAFNG